MLAIETIDNLGHAEHGWLSARHHFSFAEYHDPDRMGLGPLRVWNDDLIRAHSGFPMHPHRDMEILTYVRRGAISHEDSIGNRGRTEAGDVQVMSAGTGIVHSEYNHEDGDTEIFQIWIHPNQRDLEPRWEARSFPDTSAAPSLTVLASGRDEDRDADALVIHQDAALLGVRLEAGQSVAHTMKSGRAAYLVPSGGDLEINGERVPNRAGVAVTDEASIQITAQSGPVDVVLVDVAYPWQG